MMVVMESAPKISTDILAVDKLLKNANAAVIVFKLHQLGKKRAL